MSQLSPILKDADRCVMCGLCLPHCPTYVQTGLEPESPRGRISLMQALASGRLGLSDSLQQHLDHCLSCRACEAMCPSKVPYGRMIREIREWITLQRPQEKPALTTTLLSGESSGATALRGALKVYQRSGLPRWLKASGLLGKGRLGQLNALLPEAHASARPLPPYTPAQGHARGQLALFTGCTSPLFDPQTLQDAVQVLSRLGYGVHIPPQQRCCGGLDLQAGRGAAARALARHNLEAFSTQPYSAIIQVASGCGAILRDYSQLLGKAAGAFSEQVTDISAFIGACPWPATLELRPLPKTVALHTPCSLKNVLRQEDAPLALLRRIPGIDIRVLDKAAQCCGAAGRYMLEHPHMATALRQDKLEALAAMQADILVSSNIGCALHLGAGLRERGQAIEVIHPVSLLARQLVPTDDL